MGEFNGNSNVLLVSEEKIVGQDSLESKLEFLLDERGDENLRSSSNSSDRGDESLILVPSNEVRFIALKDRDLVHLSEDSTSKVPNFKGDKLTLFCITHLANNGFFLRCSDSKELYYYLNFVDNNEKKRILSDTDKIKEILGGINE